jgi:hypothetical protein
LRLLRLHLRLRLLRSLLLQLNLLQLLDGFLLDLMHNLLLLLLLQLHSLDPLLLLLEACLHNELEHLFFLVLLPLDLLLRLHGGFEGRLILCLLKTEEFWVDLVRFYRLLRLRGWWWIFNVSCERPKSIETRYE